MTVERETGRVKITNGKATVEILEFGATVISWRVNSKEQLWLSAGSKLDGSKAVRGGIPLVFPRFGPPNAEHAATKDLPQHGFARSVTWELLGQTDEHTVQFGLGPEQIGEFAKAWPYDFTLVYTVSLKEEALDVSLDVENPGSKPFDFNVLFHTYFAVPEVEQVAVAGLSSLTYWNKLAGAHAEESTQKVEFKGEVDRVYHATPSHLSIESKGKKLFDIEAHNLKDTVVWNPWTKTAEGMSDFEPKDGFHQMVCVENGSVKDFVGLEGGKTWKGGVTLKPVL